MRTAQNVWVDMTGANGDQCAANKLDRPACNRAPNGSKNKRDRASHKRRADRRALHRAGRSELAGALRRQGH